MKSSIFYTDAYKHIQGAVLNYLNSRPDFLTVSTAKSTRAAGDAIESLIKVGFEEILGDLCASYTDDFSRRAMADFSFEDKEGFKYVVDVKTHRTTDTKFSMPNLTSVKRLSDFYRNDFNYFVLLIVSYTVEKNRVIVSNVEFVPIEFIGWDCLRLGALGWGQIQISDSNHITVNTKYSRKKWMSELCDSLLNFYPGEITKISQRITYFEKVKEFWIEKDTD